MNNKYYVYQHILADTGEVVYVGKGCGDRYKSIQRSNPEHVLLLQEDKIAYSVLKSGMSAKDALTLERDTLLEIGGTRFNKVKSGVVKNLEDYRDLIFRCLSYDETSPTFLRYKETRSTVIKAGDPAGSKPSSKNVYPTVGFRIDRKYIYFKINRVVLFLHGLLPNQDYVVDHRDRDRHNSSVRNLVATTHTLNTYNRDTPRGFYHKKTSGYDYVIATWYDEFGKSIRKAFSVKKLGWEEAEKQAAALALSQRSLVISKLSNKENS